jgi:hypothetical protein
MVKCAICKQEMKEYIWLKVGEHTKIAVCKKCAKEAKND